MCLGAELGAVLRSSTCALTGALTPFGGWSLPSPPTRGALVVSHSCARTLLFVGCARIPRPFGAERLGHFLSATALSCGQAR